MSLSKDDREKLIKEARSNEHTFGTPAGAMRLIHRLADALAATIPETGSSHDCGSCQECASMPGHDQCCGCYDGVCCRDSFPVGGEGA